MMKYLAVFLACSTFAHASVTEIYTNEQFDSEVAAVTSLVVVDFYAPWCGPCKVMLPQFTQLSVQYPNVKFVKVNVDDAPQLKARFNISSIPQFWLFKRGTKVATVHGANRSALKDAIEKSY